MPYKLVFPLALPPSLMPAPLVKGLRVLRLKSLKPTVMRSFGSSEINPSMVNCCAPLVRSKLVISVLPLLSTIRTFSCMRHSSLFIFRIEGSTLKRAVVSWFLVNSTKPFKSSWLSSSAFDILTLKARLSLRRILETFTSLMYKLSLSCTRSEVTIS
ncbi:hypothetical protein D3C85_1112840 [compost metagenome]